MDTKNIKDFPEILQINDNTRLLGIGNNNIGDGAKITIDRLMSQSISPSENNLLQLDDNNKLYVPKSGEIVFNNPFAFGDFKYSDHTISNLSWVLSDGQRKSGTFYERYYNWLLALYNGEETIAGISVKSVNDSSATDYDYKIDSNSKEFILPVKTKVYPSAASDTYLYYFIGDVIQGANVIDVVKLEEQITNLNTSINTLSNTLNNRVYPKSTYVSGTSGYMIWSNGYCVQWGQRTATTTGGTVTLIKKYSGTNYNISLAPYYYWTEATAIIESSKTANSFQLQNAQHSVKCDWVTRGILASGEY